MSSTWRCLVGLIGKAALCPERSLKSMSCVREAVLVPDMPSQGLARQASSELL